MTYSHVIPKGWNSMVVVHSGSVSVQNSDAVLKAPNAVVYKISQTSDEEVHFTTREANTKFILLAGKPLNEPIANYGPFVLNTQE